MLVVSLEIDLRNYLAALFKVCSRTGRIVIAEAVADSSHMPETCKLKPKAVPAMHSLSVAKKEANISFNNRNNRFSY